MREHIAIAQPEFAMLTALGPEHLNGLGSWDNAVEEELILFRNSSPHCARIWQCCEPRLFSILDEVREGDTLVCDIEQLKELPSKARQLAELARISVLSFDLVKVAATQSVVNCTWKPAITHESQASWSQSFEVPMPGRHNANNFALALAAASNIVSDVDALLEAWKSFVQPEMRSRVVKLSKNVILYDDCYNSSPSSLDAALAALNSAEWTQHFKILVLGDMLDLGLESKTWHLKLSEKLLKIKNAHLCLFGSAMYDVFNELKTKHKVILEKGNVTLTHLSVNENPERFFTQLQGKIEGSVILVKGSRGMDLGRFVRVCEEWSAAQG
jgi:UDP-N-acetylmuramoyl-tripeptide--D-alanyl-D-alanine ligase